jgi:hypothetical protein
MLGAASPFKATASGVFFYGSVVAAGTATTTTCTITPVGGATPYTYAWTRTSGDTTCPISSATAAAVTWSHTFGPVVVLDSFWQCVVTDNGGQTFTISGIQAELERA